ncbi:MAG: nicotinate-nucleotide adenylyltransferase [Halanaerobiales bacterium]|nr:nicotinate-nucleotide adenylyltransferase [Halanaerobiales bacterium]
MKFAIIGGTFNPVHIGHLIIAERAYLEFNLDKVIFMPAGNPPHKNNENVIDKTHRINMLKTVIEDNEHFDLSLWEINSNGKSYTVKTIDHFKDKYDINKVNLIIGTDSLAQIFNWYKPHYVLSNSNLYIAKRSGYSYSETMKDQRLREYQDSINLLDNSLIDISSTMIREYVRDKKSVRYLTPDKIIGYIKENNLYG